MLSIDSGYTVSVVHKSGTFILKDLNQAYQDSTQGHIYSDVYNNGTEVKVNEGATFVLDGSQSDNEKKFIIGDPGESRAQVFYIYSGGTFSVKGSGAETNFVDLNYHLQGKAGSSFTVEKSTLNFNGYASNPCSFSNSNCFLKGNTTISGSTFNVNAKLSIANSADTKTTIDSSTFNANEEVTIDGTTTIKNSSTFNVNNSVSIKGTTTIDSSTFNAYAPVTLNGTVNLTNSTFSANDKLELNGVVLSADENSKFNVFGTFSDNSDTKIKNKGTIYIKDTDWTSNLTTDLFGSTIENTGTIKAPSMTISGDSVTTLDSTGHLDTELMTLKKVQSVGANVNITSSDLILENNDTTGQHEIKGSIAVTNSLEAKHADTVLLVMNGGAVSLSNSGATQGNSNVSIYGDSGSKVNITGNWQFQMVWLLPITVLQITL